MCEGNEYTPVPQGKGEVLYWYLLMRVYMRVYMFYFEHLSSLVRIEPKLHLNDSPTYTTLPINPVRGNVRGNVSRTHGSPVWLPFGIPGPMHSILISDHIKI
jgi:hypothetical protein